MSYHIKERIKVNLLCAKNPSDEEDPFFVVSNVDDSLGMLYSKRMQIEEGFRDINGSRNERSEGWESHCLVSRI